MTTTERDLPAVFERALRSFYETFDGFAPARINEIPAQGGWTAGQTVQHVLFGLSAAPGLLNGPAEETDRDPEIFVKPLRDIFLNFSSKLESPPTMRPTGEPKDKVKLLTAIAAADDGVRDVILSKDLTETCKAAEFPNRGFLTRIEWIAFLAAHMQRHTEQLRRIKAGLPA